MAEGGGTVEVFNPWPQEEGWGTVPGQETGATVNPCGNFMPLHHTRNEFRYLWGAPEMPELVRFHLNCHTFSSDLNFPLQRYRYSVPTKKIRYHLQIAGIKT